MGIGKITMKKEFRNFKWICACNKKPCEGICKKLHLIKPKGHSLKFCPVAYKEYYDGR